MAKHQMKPWIGITCDFDPTARWKGLSLPQPSYWLARAFVHVVQHAGGIPILLAGDPTRRDAEALLARLQGVIFSGGDDLDPAWYGEKPRHKLGFVNRERFRADRKLMSLAWQLELPLLCVCAGMQLLNVMRGGTLYQDIATQLPDALPHRQARPARLLAHGVKIVPGSRLARGVGQTSFRVNSFHHQAVKRIGRQLRVVARAPDGVVEALEGEGDPFRLGVAWHPEYLYHREEERRMIKAFIHAAKQRMAL